MLPLRYLRHQLRDLLTGPALILAGFVALVVVVAGTGTVVLNNMEQQLNADSVFRFAVYPLVWGGVLLLASGGAGTDRTLGSARLLFARAVSPVGFYLQRWLLALGVLLCAVLLLAVGVAVRYRQFPASAGTALVNAALLHLVLGGLILLASAFVQRDGLTAFAVAVVQQFAALSATVRGQLASATGAESPGFSLASLLARVLPPIDMIRPAGAPPSGGRLLHVLLYGTALLAAALWALRTRPIGRGGRA